MIELFKGVKLMNVQLAEKVKQIKLVLQNDAEKNFNLKQIPELDLLTDSELEDLADEKIMQLHEDNILQIKIKTKVSEFFDFVLKDPRCDCFRADFLIFHYEIEDNDYDLSMERTQHVMNKVLKMEELTDKSHSNFFYLNGMKTNHGEYKKCLDVMKNGYFLSTVRYLIFTLIGALDEDHLDMLKEQCPPAPVPSFANKSATNGE